MTTARKLWFTSCPAPISFNMWKDTTALPAIVWYAWPNYPGNISSAEWFWGDGSSTVGLYPPHTYSAAGFYNICVSITVSCGGTGSVCSNYNIYKTANMEQNAMAQVNVVASPQAIKKNTNEQIAFRLFPNPNQGEFDLQLGNVGAKTEIVIYDIVGKEVYRRIEETPDHKLDKKINLSELSNGSYFIKVNSENAMQHSKIIIAR
jgi:hypothetical protein